MKLATTQLLRSLRTEHACCQELSQELSQESGAQDFKP